MVPVGEAMLQHRDIGMRSQVLRKGFGRSGGQDCEAKVPAMPCGKLEQTSERRTWLGRVIVAPPKRSAQ
jgi:hypothetical protein